MREPIVKRLAILAVGALAVAGLVTSSLGQDKPRQKAIYTVTTKNVSVALSAHSSIPLTLGYWGAEGVDLEVTSIEGSTAGLQQLAAGNVQFVTVGPEVALMAREKGVKVKSFYVVNSVTIFRVVVPKDSPVETAAHVRGKTVGVSALSSGAVPVARAIVSSGGLNPDADVKWLAVGIGGPAALALRQKNIDAMALWGDFQAGLENLGLQFREITAPLLKDLLRQVVIARDDYLPHHPHVAIALGRGMAKATLLGLPKPPAPLRTPWTR